MTELTTTETKRLKICEATINAGKASWLAVGQALSEIKENRLYRQYHSTFEDYCQKRWGWGRIRAFQLIKSSAVAKALPSKMLTMVNTERAARALEKVDPEKRAEVVERAEKAGPVTAAAITRASKVVVVDAVELDKEGVVIPRNARDFWGRAQEVQDILTTISRICSALKKAKADKDNLFLESDLDRANSDLGNAYTNISASKPYAVCPTCGGKGCKTCFSRGVVGKFRWDRQIPDETKQAHLKEIKKIIDMSPRGA